MVRICRVNVESCDIPIVADCEGKRPLAGSRARPRRIAIGVIISIVYLAVQIRNQNKESQRQAMNALTTHWSDLNRTLVENPEMAVLWLRALRSFETGCRVEAEVRCASGAFVAVCRQPLSQRIGWNARQAIMAGI